MPPGLAADSPEMDTAPSGASVAPDLSQDGPFDAHQATSAAGDVPLVLDSLLGCQYRMTSYNCEEVADVDPAYSLQPHHLRLVGASLELPSGELDSDHGV